MTTNLLSRRETLVLMSGAVLATTAAAASATTTSVTTSGRPGRRVVTRQFEFSQGSGGMLAGFCDYALSTNDMRLRAEVRPLPASLRCSGSSRNAYYLEGNNRSDDLFMYLKAVLTAADGVVADRTYLASFDIELASKNNNCTGAGGSESSVYLKAGASTIEPVTKLAQGSDYLSINVDKGDQAEGGTDIGLIGSIWNGLECPADQWRMLRRSYAHPTEVSASPSGELWIAVGTDSGYEALTGVYYYSIRVQLQPV